MDDGGGGGDDDDDGDATMISWHYLCFYNKISGLESIISPHIIEKALKLRGERKHA